MPTSKSTAVVKIFGSNRTDSMLRLYLIEFLIFGHCLLQYARYIRGVLFGLTVLVLSGCIALAYVEEMPLGDAMYFAFVTGLTIGYGDIAPATMWGRVISICIGFVGVLFTGMSAQRSCRDGDQCLRTVRKYEKSQDSCLFSFSVNCQMVLAMSPTTSTCGK